MSESYADARNDYSGTPAGLADALQRAFKKLGQLKKVDRNTGTVQGEIRFGSSFGRWHPQVTATVATDTDGTYTYIKATCNQGGLANNGHGAIDAVNALAAELQSQSGSVGW